MTNASDPGEKPAEVVGQQMSMADLLKLMEILERKREFYHARSMDSHATHHRGLFLLNGGGAIALATFYGNAIKSDPTLVSHFVVGLALFAFLLGAYASLIAQVSHGGYIDRWWQFLPKEQTMVELLLKRDIGEIQEVFHSDRQEWSYEQQHVWLERARKWETKSSAFLLAGAGLIALALFVK